MLWQPIQAPPDARPPDPLVVRVQTIPPRSYFPEHQHDWAQVVYAIAGALNVVTAGRSFVISPEQAVWLPRDTPHRVGSLFGAEFRSLWLDERIVAGLAAVPRVFAVSMLLRALILEAAAIAGEADADEYASRVSTLIIDQLRRAPVLPVGLPWPRDPALIELCESLYADPADPLDAPAWAARLAMSARTLSRRFEAELGMSLRSWRRRLRLFKAIEFLGGGMEVTQVALELGYGSSSAFIYAFRSEMGVSPSVYARRQAQGSGLGEVTAPGA